MQTLDFNLKSFQLYFHVMFDRISQVSLKKFQIWESILIDKLNLDNLCWALHCRVYSESFKSEILEPIQTRKLKVI